MKNIITDNYIWFIISGCSLLLIIIGYYAEKTGFGKHKFGGTEELVSSEENVNPSAIVNNNIPINDAVTYNANGVVLENNEGQIYNNTALINQSTVESVDTIVDNVISPNDFNTTEEDIWKF